MAGTVEFVPGQQKTEQVTAHVLWMTTGLSCEGDSVAMTSATNPSLEDIIQGVIPGMPRVVIHNQVVAYEVGQEYIQAWYDAEQGKLDPFVLIIEGSIGNEEINGEGHWTGFGVNPENGQPITTNEWVDRLANKAAAVVADRDVRHLRRHPGDEEQPDRRDGPARLPRLEVEVQGRAADRLHPGLPGAARQHDRDAAVPRAAPRRAWRRRPSSTTSCGPSGCSAARCARAATAPATPSRASSPPSTATTRAAWSSSAARDRWSAATCPSAAGSTASAAARTSAASAWPARCRASPTSTCRSWTPTPGASRGERHAVHLRPDPALLPPAQHQAASTTRSRSGASRAGADHRLPEALVAEEERRWHVETPQDQKVVVKEMSWDPITRIVG